MQSFKLYVVSDHLKDIYPYLEKPFLERYDKTEVYHAVFDRSIPKLVEILLMENLDFSRYRDALITLNEMVSHQENKDEMISQGLVEISSAFLHHKVIEVRREAALLLGSLCTIMQGRQHLTAMSQQAFKEILHEENLLTRMACAWSICRIVTGADGVEILVDSQVIRYMVQSFIKFTDKADQEEAAYIILLLEAFVNILQYDNGIIFFVDSGIVKRMNELLISPEKYFDEYWQKRVNYLCLDCLAKISVNHEGKQEGINQKIIQTAAKYLESPVENDVQYAVILIMNCSIHLEGKKQCVTIDDHIIITRLINILVGLGDVDKGSLRRNIKVTLQNLAEYKEAFLIITAKIVKFGPDRDKMIDLLDEIFGPEIIVPLSDLLSKTSDLDKPPQLIYTKFEDQKVYCQAIGAFVLQKSSALQISMENIVNAVEKIVPFVAYNQDRKFQDLVFQTLTKLCDYDPLNIGVLANYLDQYGTVRNEYTNTTLNEELKNHHPNHLYELIAKKQGINSQY